MRAANIVALMQTAHDFGGKAVPVIVFETDEGRVKFYRQTENSKAPGSISMNDGGARGSDVWFGSIDKKTGSVRPTRECPGWVKVLIVEFDKAPAHFAANYGLGTSRCCFCATTITTNASLSVGYGPICAERYGLPWGKKTTISGDTLRLALTEESNRDEVNAAIKDAFDGDDFADFTPPASDPLAALEAASETKSEDAAPGYPSDYGAEVAGAQARALGYAEALKAIEILIDHAGETYPHFESPRGVEDIEKAVAAVAFLKETT